MPTVATAIARGGALEVAAALGARIKADLAGELRVDVGDFSTFHSTTSVVLVFPG